MLEAEAVVVAVRPGMAEVEVADGEGCGHCHTEGGCGGGSFLGLGPPKRGRLEIPTDLELAPGDRVVLGLPESGYLRASAAIYLAPLLTMFAGAGLVAALVPGAPQGLVLAAGVAGLGGGFLWLRGYSRRLAADVRYRPRLLRRRPGIGERVGPPGGSSPAGARG